MRHNKQLAQVRSRESFLWWRTSVRSPQPHFRTQLPIPNPPPAHLFVCLPVPGLGPPFSLRSAWPQLFSSIFSSIFHWWSTGAAHCGRALQLRLLWHINRSHRPATSEAVKFYWFQWPGFAQWLSTVHTVRLPRKLTRIQDVAARTRAPDGGSS